MTTRTQTIVTVVFDRTEADWEVHDLNRSEPVNVDTLTVTASMTGDRLVVHTTYTGRCLDGVTTFGTVVVSDSQTWLQDHVKRVVSQVQHLHAGMEAAV